MSDTHLAESTQEIEGVVQDGFDGGAAKKTRSISGISLLSVLELLSQEGKTCLFEVAVPGENSGLIYFYQGMIWSAVYDKQQGETALFIMLTKKNVRINFLTLPKKKIKRCIEGSVAALLLKWEMQGG